MNEVENRPAPEDEAELAQALEESYRGPLRELTPEEIRRGAESGEWPEDW